MTVPARFSEPFSWRLMATLVLEAMILPLAVWLPFWLAVIVVAAWTLLVLFIRYGKIDGRSPLLFLWDWLQYRRRARRAVFRRRGVSAYAVSCVRPRVPERRVVALGAVAVLLAVVGAAFLGLSFVLGGSTLVAERDMASGGMEMPGAMRIAAGPMAASVMPVPAVVSGWISLSAGPAVQCAGEEADVDSRESAGVAEESGTGSDGAGGCGLVEVVSPADVNGELLPDGRWWIWLHPILVDRVQIRGEARCWEQPVYRAVPVGPLWGAVACPGSYVLGVRGTAPGRVEVRFGGRVVKSAWLDVGRVARVLVPFSDGGCVLVLVYLDRWGMVEVIPFAR